MLAPRDSKEIRMRKSRNHAQHLAWLIPALVGLTSWLILSGHSLVQPLSAFLNRVHASSMASPPVSLPPARPDQMASKRMSEGDCQRPLSFGANIGQTDSQVMLFSRGDVVGPSPSPLSRSGNVLTPIVIDFENLPADGPGTGAAVVVTSQYADRGIIFNGPVALDYSKGPLAIPGFAHSGVKAIEQCYGAEFCAKPVEMSFTEAQRRVKVWVGYGARLTERRTVLLRAFDASGNPAGSATATLDPSVSPQPIRTPLEVISSSANITRAAVSFSPGTVLMNNLAVDDVEFDVAGPRPTCLAIRNPTVTLNQPPNGIFVGRNEFILQGSVSTETPLEAATLTVTGAGGLRSLNLLGSNLISPNGGNFGPVAINDTLFAGLNTVTVSAQNCRGAGQSSATVTLPPAPRIFGAEVNQGLPDYPLVAGKTALVRVYIGSSVAGAPTRVDRATLDVTAQSTGRTFSVNA